MSGTRGTLIARWRLGLRLARRDARRHVGRTALVAVMVALPVLAGTTALTALESSKESPERVRVESLGPDLQASLIYRGGHVRQTFDATNATWGGGAESGEPPTRAEHEAELADVLPPGDRLVPVEAVEVVLHGPELHLTSRMARTDLRDADVAAAFKVRDGAAPGPDEIALARGVAEQIGVEIGDVVEVEARGGGTETRKISGLLGRHLPKEAGAVVHTDPDDVSPSLLAVPGRGEVGWFVSGPTPVTWDDALRLNEHGVAVISQEVLTDLPPREAQTLSNYGGGLLADELALGGAITIIALLEGILVVGPAFAVSARRQERSLAIAAAQGASPRALRALAMAPAVVIGLGASVLAALAGIAVAAIPVAYYELPAVVVPWPRVGGMVLVGLVVAVAAAWMPARAAARLDVVATLTGRRGNRRARGWATAFGVLLAGAGLAGTFAATAANGDANVLAWCIVVAEIGLVMTTGGIVAGLARISGRLPLPTRFALRDAARHRSRTSPAIAAVLVAVAGATAGLIYLTSDSQFRERVYTPISAPGATVVYSTDTTLPLNGLRPEIEATIRGVLPGVTTITPVPVLAEATDGTSAMVMTVDLSGAGRSSGLGTPVVDDGDLVPVLGLTGKTADAAVTALRAGRAVVPHGTVSSDGTVELQIQTYPASEDALTGETLRFQTVRVPATEVGDGVEAVPNLPIIPPALLDELGSEERVERFVVETDTVPTTAQTETLADRLGDLEMRSGLDPSETEPASAGSSTGFVTARTERGPEPTGEAFGALLIALIAAAVALGVTWLAAGLAAAESRPDLATLEAVGATPRTRRTVVAAQAGAISVVGTVLGLGTGGVLGAALVRLMRSWEMASNAGAWTVEVPWLWLVGLAVTLPVLAVSAAWLVTRPRLLLTRRLA
ncbi:FtsX-like permease family protein [Promicromonospora sp. CA-289599]|uniref:FtsX-like permease family protein n=1 Tax=Promicromonospora sp. CA-289599 TaxID=3240014 RepID=UPI003D8F09AA